AGPTLLPYTTLFRSFVEVHDLYRRASALMPLGPPGTGEVCRGGGKTSQLKLRRVPESPPAPYPSNLPRRLGGIRSKRWLPKFLRSEEHTSELQSREN